MSTRQIAIAAVALFLSITACKVALCNPGQFGLPERLGSLTDLASVLQSKSMSPVQKTEVLLQWLGEEANKPSVDTMGLGGGSITSGYIQIQIIMALREVGDLRSMDHVAHDAKANVRVRDGVRITLALLGDRRQLPYMKLFLLKHEEAYFRAIAAKALAHLGAKEMLTELKAAMSDSYKVTCGASMRVKTDYDDYPVRMAAAEALRNLSNSDVIAQAEKRMQQFDKRFAELNR